MKIKLLIFLALVSLSLEAQISRVETFYPGTKVTFYLNKCGEEIPESQGKLTFCDKINNLAVVEQSYGLSSNGVTLMFDNMYNGDEIYLTRRGVSIKNTDGSWENIPHISIHKPETGSSNDPKIINGLLTPDNKLILVTQNAGKMFYVYNRTTKKMSTVALPDDRYLYQCVYDAKGDATYFVVGNYNADTFLYRYKNGNLIYHSTIGGVSSRTDIRRDRLTIDFRDDKVYLLGVTGLIIHDTKTFVTQKLNSTSTPSIPFDEVSDFQIDGDGNIWISNLANNDGALVKFNLASETYESYQMEQPNSTYNFKFNKLAVDENGLVWAVSSSYSGLISLSSSSTDGDWTLYPKSGFEIPFSYVPNNVYFKNNKVYFTTNDYSSGSNNNYEVIIRENNTWSGINDNVDGNISTRTNSRFQGSYPDNNGGVWWFNQYDKLIFHRAIDESFDHILTPLSYNMTTVDFDGKAIFMGGNPSGMRKVDFPDSQIYADNVTRVRGFHTKENQIWAFIGEENRVDVFEDGSIVKTYDLPVDLKYYYKFVVTDDDNIWFSKKTNDGLIITKFDTSTSTTTNDTIDFSFYGVNQMIAAPNNAFWVITKNAVIYYKNGISYIFKSADYPGMLYNIAGQCKVDANGKLYLLNNDVSSIVTLENPTSDEPILTKFILEDSYNQNLSLIPLMDHYRAGTISIDNQGGVWTHASHNTFKLVDGDLATEYMQVSNPSLALGTFADPNISIYPNPACGFVNIEYGTNKIDKVELFSVRGERINIEVSNTKLIDISSLNSGVYFIKLYTSDSYFIKKLIKK